jgi:hypothetical protein
MGDGFELVNAIGSKLRPASGQTPGAACPSPWPGQNTAPYWGRTAKLTLKLGFANGWTRAWLNAVFRQDSAGVPAAGPDIATF